MFKKSLVGSALLALTINAHALGLGNLNVNSYLEQPLDVSLSLVVGENDDLNTLEVSAATKSEFEAAGIIRQSFVNDLSFEVVRTGVNPYIRVTSKKPVKDPFVHLLIRFKWNSGELLREYTALIDPPIYAADSPTPVASPKTIGQDVLQNESAATNAAVNVDEGSVAATPDASAGVASLNGESYGPVTAGESLSMIAKQIQDQYPDLSIYQIMYILYRNNPSAFLNENINQLVKGSVLEVGNINSINSVDVNEGKTLFYDHLAKWSEQAVSDQASGGQDEVKVSSDTEADVAQEASTAIAGSVPTDAGETAAVEQEFKVGSSELQSASQVSGASNDGADVALLREQLADAESKLSNSELENDELQARISLLEEQLADVNKLLELKSATGADIVAGLTKEEPEVEEPITQDIAQLADDLTTDAGSVVDNAADSIADSAGNLLDTASESATDALTTEEPVVDDPVVDETIVNEPIVEEPVVEEPKVDVQIPVEPEYQTSFTDKISDFLGSSWKLVLGGIAALLLALIGLAVARKKRSEAEFEESVSGISDMVLDTKTASTTVSSDFQTAETTVTKESSFLTVYSDSEVVVHADEIDPIAEADVYIAYGRDEQGEEVLLEGIRKFPNRPDIKLSLLKLYMKRKDVSKFDTLAEELHAAGENDNPDIWTKVVEMGSVLSPDNSLYGDGKSTNGDAAVAVGATAATSAAIAAAASEAKSLLSDDIEVDAADDIALDDDFDAVEQVTADADIVIDEAVADDVAFDELDLDSDLEVIEESAADLVDADAIEIDDPHTQTETLTLGLDAADEEMVDFQNLDFASDTEVTVSVDNSDMSEISISDDASFADALEGEDLDVQSVVEFDNYERVTEVDVDLIKEGDIEDDEELIAEADVDLVQEDETDVVIEEPVQAEFEERSTQEIVEEALAMDDDDLDLGMEPNIAGPGVDFDEPLSIQLEDVTLDVTPDAEVADPNTQLELAKVFIELDDISGAKEILAALSDTDDKGVKKEAADLLKSLDA